MQYIADSLHSLLEIELAIRRKRREKLYVPKTKKASAYQRPEEVGQGSKDKFPCFRVNLSNRFLLQNVLALCKRHRPMQNNIDGALKCENSASSRSTNVCTAATATRWDA